MNYLKKFKLFESSSRYVVAIEWEHGDADSKEVIRYPFSDEDTMTEFLNFIYDIRRYIPNSGYANAGYFSDGHYERERKWINDKDKKYGGKFSSLIPIDKRFGSNDYSPAVESIWVEIDKLPLYIIWSKALKTKIIDLPKIGDTIETNTGQIGFYGPSLWGRNYKNFYGYDDFKFMDIDLPSGKYESFDCKVVDCKIDFLSTYERYDVIWDKSKNKEIITNKYTTYYDQEHFQYILLCQFADKFITISEDKYVGYDPNFEKKYHYPKYGTGDYFLV